jgi:hypothetical protein
MLDGQVFSPANFDPSPWPHFKPGLFHTEPDLGKRLAGKFQEVSSVMRRFLGSFLLGAVMVMPVVVRADDEHERREANRAGRYYDRDAKAWHEWNQQEEPLVGTTSPQPGEPRMEQAERPPAAGILALASPASGSLLSRATSSAVLPASPSSWRFLA